MYERLLNKNEMPTMDEFFSHIGKEKELFVVIDAYISDNFNAAKSLKFDAHSRCWKMNYSVKKSMFAILSQRMMLLRL